MTPRFFVLFDTVTNIKPKAIVHGDPPSLPDEGFSEEAHNFVRRCLNKNAKLRPDYGMLLRHPWLAPLMERPSVGSEETPEGEEDSSEGSDVADEADEEVDGVEGSGKDFISSAKPSTSRRQVETADKDVAEWVIDALERKNKDTKESKERPALHAVALDAVPGSPLLDDPKTISPEKK